MDGDNTSAPNPKRYDSSLITPFTKSLYCCGKSYENDANFVVLAKYLPSDKHPNYDVVMDNLLQFYLETIEARSHNCNIFFVSGLAKVDNLPKVT